MSDVLQWGLDLIISIQEFRSPLLDDIFRAISFLGEEEFFLLLIPLLFWCVNAGMGIRLAILVMLSGCANVDLKDVFQEPRPFEYDASVGLVVEEDYGMPSGHAQLSVTIWGMLASWAHKTWAWVIAVVLMALIGFSRVYLGAHFPTQVLAGWGIGVVILALYLGVHTRLEEWLTGLRLGQQIALALVVPCALLMIHPVKDTVATMAVLLGLGVGLALGQGRVTFSAEGLWWQRAARFPVGAVVMFGIFLGLKAAFPDEGEALYLPLRFVRYGLVGLWIVLGAPWLFGILRLTPKVEEPASRRDLGIAPRQD